MLQGKTILIIELIHKEYYIITLKYIKDITSINIYRRIELSKMNPKLRTIYIILSYILMI
jgi:hypothetical protein